MAAQVRRVAHSEGAGLSLDIELIEKLVLLLEESGAGELEVAAGGLSVKVCLGPEPHPAHQLLQDDERPADETGPEAEPDIAASQVVRAGMVGIFHHVDGVAPGVVVKPQDTLGLVQSMKLMNEVKSLVAGTIEEMLVEDGSPVEYGQELFTIREAV